MAKRNRLVTETAFAQEFEDRAECNRAERYQYAQTRQRIELLEQIRKAVPQLFRRRLILRGRTPRRGGDECVAQLEAVVSIGRVGLRREAGTIERRIKERTRGVSGERASGTVAAVRARGETNDHYARPRIAERGHRFAPVLAVAMGALAFARDLRSVGSKLWAARAAHDAILNFD